MDNLFSQQHAEADLIASLQTSLVDDISGRDSIEFEEKLWALADKMRGHIDPAEYKYIVLGLIFLKHVSDRCCIHYSKLLLQGKDVNNKDLYKSENIFWVPVEARWGGLAPHAQSSDIGELIEKAMRLLEEENASLKDALPKGYARSTLDTTRLGHLVEVVDTLGLSSQETYSQDVIGRVYEYFLARFAGVEANTGGEFYTPRSVVRLLVEMIEPFHGNVYDPCCGSAGMFVQSDVFLKKRGDQSASLTTFGQESNPNTWRLAKMNMAMRSMKADLGSENADTFTQDLHPELKADFILANPPFNMSYWAAERLKHDKRWQFGMPPASGANFAWVQHIIHHLAPNGFAGFVLSNGALSSNAGGEGKIRQAIIEADLIDCIVALPTQLFYGTSIAASLWFLSKNKQDSRFRARQGQTLFIDARSFGSLVDRTHRELSATEIAEVAKVYHAWKGASGADAYKDKPGFCKSASLQDIENHKWALVPGRYVGFARNLDTAPDQSRLIAEVLEVEERLQQVATASQAALEVLKGLLHG